MSVRRVWIISKDTRTFSTGWKSTHPIHCRKKHQLFIYEDRSAWPTKECPFTPPMYGEKTRRLRSCLLRMKYVSHHSSEERGSVHRQTLEFQSRHRTQLPEHWVIVDDARTDRTAEIVGRLRRTLSMDFAHSPCGRRERPFRRAKPTPSTPDSKFLENSAV